MLDPKYTLYFVIPLVGNQFDLIPEILHELFLVSNPIWDSVKAEGVYREIDDIVASPFEIKLGVIRFKS